PAELRAAMQHGEHLPRIEQPRRIERALETLLMREIGFRELLAHQVALLDSDAVLAGEHTAHLHAQAQDGCSERLRPLQLSRHVRIEKDQRRQIAIARMEHVRDAQSELALELPQARE